jgi:hypothetical protein
MAVPAVPSVGSRAIYFPAQGTAASLVPAGAIAPNQVTWNQGVPAGDLAGPATGVPAIVLKVGPGASPDFAGTQLLVFDQNGAPNVRSTGMFGSVSTTTWTGAGSPVGVAHWNLIDTTT